MEGNEVVPPTEIRVSPPEDSSSSGRTRSPCKFCQESPDQPIHGDMRLQIMSGGLVCGKDAGRETIMDPPSPCVQNPEEEIWKAFSIAEENESDNEASPPATVLTRRSAIVSARVLTDVYANSSPENRQKSMSLCAAADLSKRKSIVVIPPMQICPGDLLVYSKVAAELNSQPYGDADHAIENLVLDQDSRRMHTKITWPLFRMFDKGASSRRKSETMSGLENVLKTLKTSSVRDTELCTYKGMTFQKFRERLRDSLPNQGRSASAEAEERGSQTRPPSPPQGGPMRPLHASYSLDAEGEECSEDDREDSATAAASLEDPRAGCGETREVVSSARPLLKDTQSSSEEGGDVSQELRKVPAYSSNSRLSLPPKARRTQELLWDLFQSHIIFVYDYLLVLKNVYMEPLKKIQVEGYTMYAEPELLFGDLEELSTCKLYEKMKESFDRYILNYINALNYLEILRKHMEFMEFEKKSALSLTESWNKQMALATTESSVKYTVFRQPLSWDRLVVLDLKSCELNNIKLDFAFSIVCANRFRQITLALTFQATSLDKKREWLESIQEAQERWKVKTQSTPLGLK